MLSLPIFPEITKEQIEMVITAVKNAIEENDYQNNI